MADMFQGILDQFKSILDVSMVQPVFGIKGLFWLFIVLQAAVRLYLGYASRQLRESDPDYRQDLVRHFWIKVALLFFILRPFCMVSSPEAGRFNAFLLNGAIDLVMVGSAFLRMRFTRADEARFEEWTEIDAPEGISGEEPA